MIALALVAVFSFSECASADPLDLGYGETAFEACIAETADCLGQMADPCIEANGNSTMAGVLCWSAEGEAWNREIAQSLSHLDKPERREALDAAQAQWEAWRDAECAYRSDPSAGGSGVQFVLAHCMAELGSARLDMLRQAEMNQ